MTAAVDADGGLRGRRRSRNTDRPEDAGGAAAAGNGGSPDDDVDVEGPSRKRRRSRKGLDKKFECPFEGCGKSYSRAEHLYRHQLNHSPKQIYRCEYPGCPREFVRQDLCQRHQERHTAKNPQLQRTSGLIQGFHAPPASGIDVKSPLEPGSLARRMEGHAPPGHEPLTTPVKSEPPPSPYHERDRTLTPVKNEASQSPRAATHKLDGSALPAYQSPFDPSVGANAAGPAGSPVRGRPTATNHVHAIPNGPGVQPRMPDRTVSGSSVSLKRANSESGHRADDAKRILDASVTPRSTPQTSVGTPRRGASFGSVESGRPQFVPVSDGSSMPRPPGRGVVSVPNAAAAAAASPLYSSYPAIPGPTRSQGDPSQVTTTATTTMGGAVYVNAQGFVPISLPPPVYANASQASSSRTSDGTLVASPSTSLSSIEQQQQQAAAAATRAAMQPGVSEAVLVDPATYGATAFGGYGMTRSPFAMPEAFADWLFNDQHVPNSLSMGQHVGSTGIFNFSGPLGPSFQPGFMPDGLDFNGFDPQLMAHQHPMAVTSILGPEPVETQLSEDKRQQLLDLIVSRFNEPEHTPVERQKDDLLSGDRDADGHVLSLTMLRTYIGSYWYHFHPQLPLLHRPTFVPDETQNLLLIAMITIGASCLEKVHGHAATQDGARLASFLASHLRWEIFINAHFTPPAKLWVFQALLLLEVYEKLYSTRSFHERAHIHHATTITLMRRGSSLVGKSALDSPPSVREEKTGQGPTGSNQPSGATTPDKWWNDWITAEATRRAAFAAFVIDAMHATMFGHSAAMVAHEMQLPLPHDEALWSATSGAEVGRMEANMRANGIERLRFLDGLKSTLNGKSVRTNAFGRTILMAGLLSVSWHMNQRDLQLNSLGVVVAMGGRDRWRGALRAAFDFWKRDFDDSLAENPEIPTEPNPYALVGGAHRVQEDIIFESKNVLHHLAHMAMHVDIIDCQIFARAPRLLGRTIAPPDYKAGADRMREWAPTAKARDATFYALRFLSDVLCTAHYGPSPSSSSFGTGAVSAPDESVTYSAREDSLMNRPWVLYFAALIVWSYGYALEGPLPPSWTAPATPAEKHRQMREFLHRVGSVESPEGLSAVRGRNQSVGLLMVVRDMFETTRWELLEEASRLLSNCVELLLGSKQ